MTSEAGTATVVADVSENFAGRAVVYRMEPKIAGYARTYRHVVVSTAYPMGRAETYIFGATEAGKVLDWAELDGSCGGESHEAALLGAGYVIAQEAAND